MRTELFDYHLPPELIAQTPAPRGQSRLLVLHRKTGHIEHRRFEDLTEYLSAGDTLVMNNTRVTARRLKGIRESGSSAEVLLICPIGERSWEALVKPGKSLKLGRTVQIISPAPSVPNPIATITATTEEGGRILEFVDTATRDSLENWGESPLPPYIHTPLGRDEEERYQTIYAKSGGSVAAPTAGLHFTFELMRSIRELGVETAEITLEVGVGTFRPVKTETVELHEMHREAYHLVTETAERINGTKGRVVAVGTTSVRTLETIGATLEEGYGKRVVPSIGNTALFITPGYRFRVVDAIVTNFHLPCSTLLMLISAFASREQIMHAYEVAIQERYRFFSFGDAMLIL
ncbi:MAG: tRNA preQ1(34) S-adenosylmethionine ribosyltransferase-isomerase QueA [Armatimonadetes bacterium]|nr:tRNA preQ1(34) S-adenosylmethionine ribosyltransferase-isomerase QueA [Armatimonadota bacterium]